jgi:hypothetical protein
MSHLNELQAQPYYECKIISSNISLTFFYLLFLPEMT